MTMKQSMIKSHFSSPKPELKFYKLVTAYFLVKKLILREKSPAQLCYFLLLESRD